MEYIAGAGIGYLFLTLFFSKNPSSIDIVKPPSEIVPNSYGQYRYVKEQTEDIKRVMEQLKIPTGNIEFKYGPQSYTVNERVQYIEDPLFWPLRPSTNTTHWRGFF